MSDVIPKPGKYQQFSGRPAEVKWVGDGKALGFDFGGEPTMWDAATGRWALAMNEPEFCCHIVSPWPPDPPPKPVDPGEGWRLLGDDEVIADGDEYLCEGGRRQWFPVACAPPQGMTVAASHGWWIRDYVPVHYRRRIPKTFRISDQGCGVYETRDGREAVVTGHNPGFKTTCRNRCEWVGATTEAGRAFSTSWTDSGNWAIQDQAVDLVRYLRPLPEPEGFLPTNELRTRTLGLAGTVPDNKRPNGTYSAFANGSWFSVVLEQKWTNGTVTEWRPIPVTTEETNSDVT